MKKNNIEHYSDKEALEFHLNNKSLTYPKILLIKVKKLNVVVDLIRFINHISLKIALFVYLNYLNEKNKN